MAISVKRLSDDVFEVTVSETSTTTYTVSVTGQSFGDLTDNKFKKTQLLKFSLIFLLNKEPDTSIVYSFDIKLISRHFSDCKDEVRRWCDESHHQGLLFQ